MAFFISVDSKRISSDTQVSKPLRKFIEEQECYNIDDFQESINEIEKLRENLRQTTDKKDIVLSLYFRYYAILSSIERRIPVTEQEVRINFNWYDIYKQKKTGRYNINYEKACVLFNIATILSQMAVLENLENSDGIKLAAKHFRTSSGTFDQLKEFLESNPEEAASIDMCADSLTMLSNLMLAQSQELFYMMALKENMKPIVISKLAAQASDFYTTALDGMSSNTLKSLIPKRWIPYAELKRDYMKAVAHYQLGRERKDAKAYGEELSRYKIASRLMDNVVKYKSQLPELSQWIDDTLARVKNSERSAQRDNDIIYHETVLPEHKLAPLGKKVMVKAERLLEEKLKCPPNNDPFAKLIPFRARKADSIYSERKAQILRDISKEVEDQNAIAKNSLHGMGLPGALEALETPHGIPLSLLKKMDMVKKDNGVEGLNEKLEVLRKMAAEDAQILDSAFSLLDEEEKDDVSMRGHYGDRWARTPSHTLTSNIRIEGQKHRANLEHAVKSDGYIQNMINENNRGIDLLCADQGQILQLLPETARQDVSISTLKQLLKQLDQLIFTRETALNQLREMLSKDDIIEKLIKTQEIEYENVFAQELSKYNDIIGKIKDSLNQTQLLTSIKEENDKFLQKRSSNEQLVQRQQVLQEFEVAFNNYTLLKEHISEGIQFYTSFQDILNKFKTKCSDFVLARKTEKQDLIQEIQSLSTRPSPGFIVTTTTSSNPPIPPSIGSPSVQQQPVQQSIQQQTVQQQQNTLQQQQQKMQLYQQQQLFQQSQIYQRPPPPYPGVTPTYKPLQPMIPVPLVPVMMSTPVQQGQSPQMVQFYPSPVPGQVMMQRQQPQQKPSAFPQGNPYNM